MESINTTDLIFGKNSCQNIISIEPYNSSASLFIQNPDGTIKEEIVPNKYWVLSSKQQKHQLAGNLYYKYGVQFSSREDFLDFRKYHKGQEYYSIYDPKESLMIKDGYTYFKGMKIDELSILSMDLETTSLEFTPNDKILLISNTYRFRGKSIKKLFCYDDFDSQGEMIDAWCKWVREVNPSIICGHNILSFDFKYLRACAEYYGTNLYLGRDESPLRFSTFESKFRKDQTQFLHYHKIHCYGREMIDTLFLAIKHDITTKKYQSYGLKPIIEAEGLVDQYRTFYDASSIRFKYKIPEEWQKIKNYCQGDSDDSLKLFDLMAPPFFYMTQSIPKSFQSVIESASGSQLNAIMVRSYLQKGHSIPKATESTNYEGAISFGFPGIYSNVLKLDVQSLYPSIMIQYEIYPVDKDPNKHFQLLLANFLSLRLEYKKKSKTDVYYEHLQQAFKIFINSLYGFLGAPGLNFNDPNKASEVTRLGRNILTKAIEWASGQSYNDWKKSNNLT